MFLYKYLALIAWSWYLDQCYACTSASDWYQWEGDKGAIKKKFSSVHVSTVSSPILGIGQQ